uniref:Ycf36 n=1 Tax=Helminthocladia australis TaxID=260093 RepID=A0A1G4NTH6_9FLOR|nr:Hypothetical protein ycf36 [Helminthocladia australis]SCW21982.1 Hypothetical protein ycf36 [Helminthocladia australis]
MSVHKKNCPVPFDQQPLNEYKALRKSPLFECSTTELSVFVTRLIFVFSVGITLGLAVTLLSINPSKISLGSIISNVLFSLFSIEFLLIRLYLGWSYVLKRLSSASIFYEESGWYDGQLWIKTVDILTKDRLVGVYQVQPLVVRIRRLLIFTSLTIIFLSIFLALMH